MIDRTIPMQFNDGIGSASCPFCDVLNMVGKKEDGLFTGISTCEHLATVGYKGVEKSMRRELFARFEQQAGE